jgi:phosphate transport system substrate-binding protein
MKTTTSSVVTLSLLAGLVAATPTVLAQPAAEMKFPLPASLPDGTKVSVGGSQSLEAINKGLQESFKKKFPGAEMPAPTYSSSQGGIEAVAQGKTDIAGVGRLLTSAEQAKGLGVKSLGSGKIAIVVSDKNPFANGNITLDQFAKIYRGEITDWSQIKGSNAKGKIRVVDRPNTSDTRQAFARYPVFKSGVKTGSNVVKLNEDSAKAVAAKLGTDGVGYVPVSQLKELSGVKALSLHKTQPDNPKYPFSQPMSYVYKKDGVSAGAKAFLGFVDTPEATAAITAAGFTPAVGAAGATTNGAAPASTGAAPVESAAAGTAGATAPDSGNGSWPWWLWPLGLIGAGAGAWMLLGGKKDDEEETEPRRLKPLYPDDAPATGTTTTGFGAKTSSPDRSIPLSGDLSMPSSNLSGTINGAVDTAKDRAGDLLKGAGTVGGVALAGGAAVAGSLLGKSSDSGDKSATLSGDLSGDLPKIDVGNPLEGLKNKADDLVTDIQLDNPLAGLQDKASDLMPNLGNPLEGIPGQVGESLSEAADKGSDLLKGLGLAGAGALAGGAALAGGLLDNKHETNESLKTPEEPVAKDNQGSFDAFGNPLESLKDKAADLLQGGQAAGGAALAGGAAVVGGAAAATSQGFQSFFSGNSEDDQSGELSLENAEFETPISALNNPSLDPFDDSILLEPSAATPEKAETDRFNPLDVIGEFKDRAMDKVQDIAGSSGAALAGGAAAAAGMAAGAGAAAKSFLSGDDQVKGDKPEEVGVQSEGQITLVSPNPAQAYVHWDVPVKLKRQLRQQGGKKLAVRMYDVTDLDISHHLPSNFQEFECDELAWDLHLPVPKADRQYLVEIGYVSESNSWLMLARSAPVMIQSEAK